MAILINIKGKESYFLVNKPFTVERFIVEFCINNKFQGQIIQNDGQGFCVTLDIGIIRNGQYLVKRDNKNMFIITSEDRYKELISLNQTLYLDTGDNDVHSLNLEHVLKALIKYAKDYTLLSSNKMETIKKLVEAKYWFREEE